MMPPMVRLVKPALIVSLLIAVGQDAGPRAWQAPGERTIYVNVIDQSEKPVRDLTPAEFMVREDNVIREVAVVKPATDPMFISVLVDTTPEAQYAVRDLRVGLATFVREVLAGSPSSQVSLGEFGGAAMTSVKFTSKAEDLEKAIPKLYPKPDVGSVLFEALVDASKELASRSGPRRFIVAINMEPSNEHSQIQLKNVAAEVRKSGASLWALSIQRGPTRNPSRDQLLTGVSTNSGGFRTVILSPAALETTLKNFAQNLLSAYAITIRRPESSGLSQQTQVLVNRPGARALTLIWSTQ